MEDFLRLGRLFVVGRGLGLNLPIQLQSTLYFPPLDKIVLPNGKHLPRQTSALWGEGHHLICLKVAFYRPVDVTAIATQGRANYNQWVTSFTLSYSEDGTKFTVYSVGGQQKVWEVFLYFVFLCVLTRLLYLLCLCRYFTIITVL